MKSFFSNERFQRALVTVSAVLLVAGVVAFLSLRTGGDDNESRPSTTAAPAAVETTQSVNSGRLERGARIAAGEFILAAVGREDLKKAWQLSHPDLRDQCGCTYKQWLKGNIPVQPYPVGNLNVAAFDIEEASPNHAVLLVALLPKKGEKVKEQTFYIGLKTRKQDGKKRWLVDYWAPYNADTQGTFAPPEG